jgi:hypothetical protein
MAFLASCVPWPPFPSIYVVVNDFGHHGRAFVETDIAEADRETVIRNFLSGQYSNALRVITFNTSEGWSRDVSEDIAGEVLERAFDADANLAEETKLFIDRYMTPGEKRPPAPSAEDRAWEPSTSSGPSSATWPSDQSTTMWRASTGRAPSANRRIGLRTLCRSPRLGRSG